MGRIGKGASAREPERRHAPPDPQPPRESAVPQDSAAPEGPSPAGREQPGKAPGRGPRSESKGWELTIAVSIAVAAVTGAALTYAAIQKQAAAADNDRQSVVQTIEVQTQRVTAETQAGAGGTLAARYRQLMAEADVLSATDPDQATLFRLNAVGFIDNNYGVSDYLSGTGATAHYDYSAALQGALAASSTSGVLPAGEPELTAKLAEHDSAVSERIRICVIGILGVVVVLTIARLTRMRRDKQLLFAVAALGYAVALAIGLAGAFANM
jgi:hypothetical protein